jgi:hypothetical protein
MPRCAFLVLVLASVALLGSIAMGESTPAVTRPAYIGRLANVPREVLQHQSARIVVNGGEFVTYSREDGAFVLFGLEAGSHLMEIHLPGFVFPPLRIDISQRKGRIQTTVNDGSGEILGASSTAAVEAVIINSRGKYTYFIPREKVNPLSFLMNPMVLMTFLTLGLTQMQKLMPQGEMKATMREMSEKMEAAKAQAKGIKS